MVLEVGACSPCCESGCTGSKELSLYISPVVLVDIVTGVKAVPIDEGPVPQGHVEFCAFSVICVPSCDWGGALSMRAMSVCGVTTSFSFLP